MLTIVARWKIKAGQIEKVNALVAEMIVETRKEPGNLCYDYYVSPTRKDEVLLFEQYSDENAIEAHRGTPHFRRLVLEQIVPLLETRQADVLRANS